MSAIITAVLISFTLLPEAAIAAEWLKVATVEDHTIYLETESVSRDDDLVRAWFLWDYTSRQKIDTPPHQQYLSAKSLSVIDCTQHARALLQIHYYSGSMGLGRQIAYFEVPPSRAVLDQVIPDSVGDIMLNIACTGDRRRPKQIHV